MFFIKFLGKIENILGDASNIFNFTLEFNEKHFNPHFLFLLKTKKTVEKVFGRVTYSGNSYLGIFQNLFTTKEYCFKTFFSQMWSRRDSPKTSLARRDIKERQG